MARVVTLTGRMVPNSLEAQAVELLTDVWEAGLRHPGYVRLTGGRYSPSRGLPGRADAGGDAASE